MKNILLLAAIGMLGFASSCKSTVCPAYATKTDRAAEQKVMVKATPETPAKKDING